MKFRPSKTVLAAAALVCVASLAALVVSASSDPTPAASPITSTSESPSSSQAATPTPSDTSNTVEALVINDCDMTEPGPCINEVIDEEIKTNGIEAGLAMMRKVFEVNKDVYAACHSFAHGVGKSAAKYYGLEAFGHATFECQRGYLHGTVQRLSGDYTKISDQVSAFSKKCSESYTDNPTLLKDCYHGTGQSTVYVDNNALEEAMNACMSIAKTKDLGVICTSGLLMEYGDGALHHAGYTSDATVDVFADTHQGDVIELCEKTNAKYGNPERLMVACYMRLWMFEGPEYHKGNKDYDKMCRDSTGEERHWCYIGIGNWIHRAYFWDVNPAWPPETKEHIDEMVSYIAPRCEALDDPISCIEGAITSTSGHLYGVYPEELTPEYCHAMSKKYQTECAAVRDRIIEMELEYLK